MTSQGCHHRDDIKIKLVVKFRNRHNFSTKCPLKMIEPPCFMFRDVLFEKINFNGARGQKYANISIFLINQIADDDIISNVGFFGLASFLLLMSNYGPSQLDKF